DPTSDGASSHLAGHAPAAGASNALPLLWWREFAHHAAALYGSASAAAAAVYAPRLGCLAAARRGARDGCVGLEAESGAVRAPLLGLRRGLRPSEKHDVRLRRSLRRNARAGCGDCAGGGIVLALPGGGYGALRWRGLLVFGTFSGGVGTRPCGPSSVAALFSDALGRRAAVRPSGPTRHGGLRGVFLGGVGVGGEGFRKGFSKHLWV
ncbi:MAG: hypothetical protein AVDCRST_MAG86-3789, partial [uncultured Truepera sp.]